MTLKKKILVGFLGLFAFVSLLNALSLGSEIQNTQTPTQETPKTPVIQEETQTPTPTVPDPTPEETKKPLYPVSKVIDGDTIEVNFGGKTEKIRLIGVNTPETVDHRRPVECFGKQASDYTKAALIGKSVSLESDPTQGDRDKYGRLLRYVFLEEGANFNKKLILEGYANEYTYNTPYKYQQEFKEAQKEAEEKMAGLWGDATCTEEKETQQTTTTAAPTPAADDSGFSCARKTCSQISTCAEAKYQLNTCGNSRLDGDKDGVPCEAICE